MSGGLPDGGTTTPTKYVAEVYDQSWHSVAIFDDFPYVQPATGATSHWSDRRVLSFPAASEGTYTVVFGASTLVEGNGSVALANVQLEQAVNGQPTSYVGTTASTNVAATNCPMSDSDLRAAFTHSCDSTGACHYDLSVPLIIDTSSLDSSPIDAKMAAGNYNYRHLTSALNLVGTGVHSCVNDPTANCYGSGYVQYDLRHDATNAGITGYDGNARVFDFGVAGIQHGKALAAERYITMPLSSNDQQLISQPGVQHVELGGRPVDGTYYLRIWDSPDLNWSALQDVQLVLDYEYWSQIQVHGSSRPVRLQRAPIRPVITNRPRRR